MSDKSKTLVRDFLLPRGGDKVAILRLEFPVTEADVNHIRAWLDILSASLIEKPESRGISTQTATVELVATDPIVKITGPAEPGAPVSKGDKDAPPGSKPHIPPPLPKPRKPRGRPATRSRNMPKMNVGKRRAAQSDKGRDTKNTPPEDLPKMKRICKDCQKAFPLGEFRAIGGLNVTYGPSRDRCRKCYNAYFLIPKETKV